MQQVKETPEHECARNWRLARGLTVGQLAELSGYSREAIYCFERGRMANGNTIPSWVWLRFKMVCAGVDQHLRTGGDFAWGQ